MVEGRVNRYGLEWHCFAQVRLPKASTLRALLLSLGINGGLLLALVFTTDNKPVRQQRLSPLLLKVVLLQPPTIPRKAESKPKLVNETNTGLEVGVGIKEAKVRESIPIASREKNEPEAPQAPLEKEMSPQPNVKTNDVRLRVQDATQNYINRLNAKRLQDIANKPPSNKTRLNVKRNPKLSNYYNNENEDFLESIEIVVDCSTLKGKLFSALSKNKGVTIEDRDFPTVAGYALKSVQGTVKCRDHNNFQMHIDKYLNKQQ